MGLFGFGENMNIYIRYIFATKTPHQVFIIACYTFENIWGNKWSKKVIETVKKKGIYKKFQEFFFNEITWLFENYMALFYPYSQLALQCLNLHLAVFHKPQGPNL